MVTRKRSFIRENPLSVASTAVATLAVIIGAGWAIDDRYAHAADIGKLSQQLEVNRLTAEVSVLEIRRSTLQDKVYEGQSRKSRSRSDLEILDRYTRELADVERQIVQKRRAVDEAAKSK